MQGAKPWNTLNIAYSKVKQRSRRCFLVELNSAGDFSDTPQAKSQKDRQHIPKRGCAACLFAFLSSSTYLFTAKRRAADLYSATRFAHHRRMKSTKKMRSCISAKPHLGAAEHSASELLRGDSIGTPTGSSSCLIPIGTRNSVSSFVYNYGEGKNLVSTWLNKPCPVWKRPFSIRKMFIPMMLRKPAVLHWNLCRIPFCQ